MKNNFIKVFLVASIMLVLSACNSETTDKTTTTSSDETNPNYFEDVTENPVVTITMESDEKIIIELMPKVAPNTVANFISLAQSGYYDGLTFHRVIPGFMIQGGDPDGVGTGGPGYSIAGEFASNGFENNLLHERGVISMARSKAPDSAGSQFFIMLDSATHLDGEYAAFGKVIEGMDVVDKIVAVDKDASNKPLQEQKMKNVTVDTKGFNYPSPVKK